VLWAAVWHPAIPLREGTAAQVRDYLIPSCQGKRRGAYAITEEDAGSDPRRVQTRADRRNGRYYLSGEKWFVTSGDAADYLIVHAHVDGNPDKPTLFLVDKSLPGVRIKRIPKFMHTYVFEHPEFRSLIPKNMLSGETGEEYRKSFLRNTPQTYSDTAEALFTMPDLSDKLHRIAVPTWVCYGADDPGPMAYSEAYRKNIPDCTLCLLKGPGHFPIWDSTESFLSELFKFLDAHPVK